jgi:hypothetical protein
MKYIFWFILLIISGCDSKIEWRDAPKEYKCTNEQMKKVEKESIWCTKNTDYFKEFCYGSAILRNCEKIVK